MRPRSLPRLIIILFAIAACCFGAASGCAKDACTDYFTELVSKCKLSSTPEGEKIDRYLEKTVFRACQLQVCTGVSTDEIDCSDPETHIPGGLNGRFETCKDG